MGHILPNIHVTVLLPFFEHISPHEALEASFIPTPSVVNPIHVSSCHTDLSSVLGLQAAFRLKDVLSPSGSPVPLHASPLGRVG